MMDWTPFLARIEKESSDILGNSQDGLAVITLSVAVGSDGKPIVWIISNSAKVEPSKDAKRVILELIG